MAAALVIVTSTVVAAAAYMHASRRNSVLAVRRAVAPGDVIVGPDLTVAEVATSPAVSVIPSSAASRVIGRRAAVALLPGTLLTPGALARPPALAPGSSLVGVALKPGELPAGGLEVGDQVMVVLTGGASGVPLGSATSGASGAFAPGGGSGSQGSGTASAAQSPVGLQVGSILAPDAVVGFVGPPPDPASGSDIQVVSLELPQALAPVVATAAVAGQVSLVLLPAP